MRSTISLQLATGHARQLVLLSLVGTREQNKLWLISCFFRAVGIIQSQDSLVYCKLRVKHSYSMHPLTCVCTLGDPTLAMWSKREEPVLPMPPPDMPLVGWRDPFIFEIKGKQGNGREWGMLMGSGLKGQGGAIMIYRSESLYGGKLDSWYASWLCYTCCHSTGASVVADVASCHACS